MNLKSTKINGIDEITIPDAFNAPIMELIIKLNEKTIPPQSNLFIITVEGENIEKSYEFQLTTPLRFINNESDEFILKTIETNGHLEMKAYINRLSNQKDPYVELANYQPIVFFPGENHFKTNYKDATIEMIYQTNQELQKTKNLYQNNLFESLEANLTDAITNKSDQINATLNQLTVDCINSSNNKFSLDKDGNLNVQSIHSTELIKTQINPLEIYPIGSIYLSVTNTNPSNYFGGTWEEIAKGRTLVGVDSSQPEFNTVKKIGGEKTHKLTLDELAEHEHFDLKWSGYNISFDQEGTSLRLDASNWHGWNDGQNGKLRTGPAGHSHPHNNLQPYFTCYIWTRTT